jgi:hypothetical protein
VRLGRQQLSADFVAEVGDQKGAVFAGSFLRRLLHPLYLAAAALTATLARLVGRDHRHVSGIPRGCGAQLLLNAFQSVFDNKAKPADAQQHPPQHLVCVWNMKNPG